MLIIGKLMVGSIQICSSTARQENKTAQDRFIIAPFYQDVNRKQTNKQNKTNKQTNKQNVSHTSTKGLPSGAGDGLSI